MPKLKRHREQRRPAKGKHPDVPSQRQEMKRPDQRATAQPCTDSESEQRVFGKIETRHCLCIHLQADQNPTVTPNTNNAALQKIPVPNE